MGLTYEDVVKLAVELPDVAEKPMYRRPAVKRGDRYMFGPGREPNTISVKIDWDTHNRWLSERPDVFFKTPHYEGWPALLARLDVLDEPLARELVGAAWEDAPKKSRVMKGSI